MTEHKLVDAFGRVHDYLRISVTDRCNLRCVYCMPEEGMTFEPDERIMSYEEITEIVRVLAPLGVRKLRITGGEPLVRKGLYHLIDMLSSIPGIDDISLSTNGIFLAPFAAALKAAGLSRVNISLDSLKTDRYAWITRGGDIHKVLKGIEASQRVGLEPIKINVVLMNGVNADEVADFLNWTRDTELHVRFIEYMPIGEERSNWKKYYLPLDYVLDTCQNMNAEYAVCDTVKGNGPAASYRLKGAKGTFGLIHPVSEHFCASCNRLRLTADGKIKACLYWAQEYNVRRHIGDPSAIETIFRQALQTKPETHEMALALTAEKRSQAPTARRMSQIGG